MSESKPQRAARRRAFWAVLALFTFTVIALGGEGLVRATSKEFTPKRHYRPGIYAKDAERRWSLARDYRGVWLGWDQGMPTSINGLGYRGPEESSARLAADLRVLVVGDSVAFGRGVADGQAYPAQLEHVLRDRGLDVAVFNLAVPGYDSYQERLTFEGSVERIDPQVVMVGWYRNDVVVHGSLDFSSLQVIDGYLVYDADRYREFRRRIAATGLQRSELLNFVRVRWKLWRKRLSREKRVLQVTEPDAEAFAATVSQLNAIQERCLERDTAFVLVVHPERSDLDSGVRGLYDALAAGVSTDRYRASTTVVAVADAWQEETSERLYQPGDRSHPSAQGHASIARRLAALPLWEAAIAGRRSTPR